MNPHDPYLDDSMRRHFGAVARRYRRRLAGYGTDDIIQECYCIYYHCRARYVGQPPTLRPDGTERRFLPVKDPDRTAKRHFMTLVKRSIANRMATLVTRQSAVMEINISALASSDDTVASAWEALMPTEEETATAARLLREAPTEIKAVLDLLVSDALKLADYRRFGKRQKRRETNNQLYCRLLGLPPEFDLAGRVEQYFCGNTEDNLEALAARAARAMMR